MAYEYDWSVEHGWDLTNVDWNLEHEWNVTLGKNSKLIDGQSVKFEVTFGNDDINIEFDFNIEDCGRIYRKFSITKPINGIGLADSTLEEEFPFQLSMLRKNYNDVSMFEEPLRLSEHGESTLVGPYGALNSHNLPSKLTLVCRIGNLPSMNLRLVRDPNLVPNFSPKMLEEFLDFEVHCEGILIRCHRFILAARSPVYRAMIANTKTAESSSGRVFIKDISYKTMKSLIDFMYQNKVSHLKIEDIEDIVMAADKYEVLDLVDSCEKTLDARMKANNAVHFLHLAKKYNMKSLEVRALLIVEHHIKYLLKSKDFYQLMKDHPDVFYNENK